MLSENLPCDQGSLIRSKIPLVEIGSCHNQGQAGRQANRKMPVYKILLLLAGTAK